MPTVKNLSYGPISFRLADDSTITLGPRETAEISGDDFENSAIQQNLRERRIAILPGTGNQSAQPEQSSERREARTHTTPTPVPE